MYNPGYNFFQTRASTNAEIFSSTKFFTRSAPLRRLPLALFLWIMNFLAELQHAPTLRPTATVVRSRDGTISIERAGLLTKTRPLRG